MTISLRHTLRSLLPPVLFAMLTNIAHGRGLRPQWEVLPGGWPTPEQMPVAFAHPSVAARQKATWNRFLTLASGTGPLGIPHESRNMVNDELYSHNTVMSFAYVLARLAHQKTQFSILDWGGGLGYYYVFARQLMPQLCLDYHCRDLDVLCQIGSTTLPDITFHSNDATCLHRPYNLVLVSGVLQYIEDWKATITTLASGSSPYLFVTRVPIVATSRSFVVIQRPYQHGYKTDFVHWVWNRADFLAHLASLGVKPVREFFLHEMPPFHGAPEQCKYYGFLFQLES